MLNLFNNNNLIENNLFTYGLILGSLSILSYSIYYAYSNSVGFVSPSESKVLKTLSLKDNPDYDNILRESLINKISIDIKKLYDYMNELLYNDATPVTSLGEMEPEVFANLLANDPKGPAFLEHIQKWCDSVPTIISSNPESHSSEINFLRQVIESMKSNISSPIENTSNIIPQFNIESIRETKLNEILKYVNEKYPTTTSDPFITDWIKGIVDQYDYLQLLSTVCQTNI